MRKTLRRRDFIQLGCVSAACCQLRAFRASSWTFGYARKKVTVHAQVGNMFPPLELVRRMCNSSQFETHGFVRNSGGDEFHNERFPRTIYVGMRAPEFDFQHRGNLARNAQEAIMRRLGTELQQRFHWEIAKTTFDSDPGFCYPYLASEGGSLIFCRLTINDHVHL